MRDLLPEYAAGSLPPAERRRVEAHLESCPDCATELAAWAALAAAARQVGPVPGAAPAGPDPAPPAGPTLAPPPGPAVVRAALTRGALAEPEPQPPAPRRARFLAALVVAEARLVRLSVLVASALVVALGVGLAAARPVVEVWAGDVLALVMPIVAAAGIAGVHGPRRDAAFELTASSPTSPRLILLIRVALVFGYDLVLAVAGSAVLTAAGAAPTGLNALIAAWLGPMALLSALSLLLAVWLGPDIAIGAAVGLWALRVWAGTPFAATSGLPRLLREAWSTTPAGAVATVALLGLAAVLAGRVEPWRLRGATHLP